MHGAQEAPAGTQSCSVSAPKEGQDHPEAHPLPGPARYAFRSSSLRPIFSTLDIKKAAFFKCLQVPCVDGQRKALGTLGPSSELPDAYRFEDTRWLKPNCDELKAPSLEFCHQRWPRCDIFHGKAYGTQEPALLARYLFPHPPLKTCIQYPHLNLTGCLVTCPRPESIPSTQ